MNLNTKIGPYRIMCYEATKDSSYYDYACGWHMKPGDLLLITATDVRILRKEDRAVFSSAITPPADWEVASAEAPYG